MVEKDWGMVSASASEFHAAWSALQHRNRKASMTHAFTLNYGSLSIPTH
jgi:hypothetical protein